VLQNRSGRRGEEKIFVPNSEPSVFQPVDHLYECVKYFGKIIRENKKERDIAGARCAK
jgi:hypothetical protein